MGSGGGIVVVCSAVALRPPFKASDKLLRSELIRVGINPVKVEFYDSLDLLRDDGYVLLCGSDPRVGREALHTLDVCPGRIGSLLYSSLHPGFVLRRKSLLPLFRNDLSVFSAMVRLDQGVEYDEFSAC